jgi:Family of unknown function (DUF6801)
MRDLRRGWRAREVARVTVIAMVLAAIGIAAGAAATTRQRTAIVSRVSLAYACRFPFGSQPVSVLAGATFPAAGTAGQPIQPTGAAVTMTLRHVAIADLAEQGATGVTAVARLTTVVTEPGRTVTVNWPRLAARAVPVPPKGGMTLTTSGAAPAVTAAAPGDVTFTAADLSLALTLQHTGGAATKLAVMRVRCTLTPGQDATLATMPVAAAPSVPIPTQTRKARQAAGPGTDFCPKLQQALKLNPRFPLPKPPPGSQILHSPGLPPYCVYVDGYSDVQKLNGAAFLGPGLTEVSPFLNSIIMFHPPKVNYFQQDSAAELSYHGLREFPPARASFLAFGFMPASAVMHLTEIGTMNVVTVGAAAPPQCTHPCPTITTVSSRLQIRIDDVTVNGVPLNVGPHCGTAPFDVILKGSDASTPPYNFITGGPVAGTVTIPPFTGCGVGENLDPLFSGSISGPGNFTLLTQGVTCQQGSPPIGCPPKPPKPLRQVAG